MDTNVTLVLEHVSPELSQAHRELYPERIDEHIPLSLTLLYPWRPVESLTEEDVEELRSFFASRAALEFDLVRVTEFPGIVAYAEPQPDDGLRSLMRALWAKYPDRPPYGRPGFDPPPHCTLGRYEGDYPITLQQAKRRVEPLLPIRCDVREATLMEEYERDRWRVREALPFAS